MKGNISKTFNPNVLNKKIKQCVFIFLNPQKSKKEIYNVHAWITKKKKTNADGITDDTEKIRSDETQDNKRVLSSLPEITIHDQSTMTDEAFQCMVLYTITAKIYTTDPLTFHFIELSLKFGYHELHVIITCTC